MQRGATAFLDTNVLVAATDTSRAEFRASRTILTTAGEAGVHLENAGCGMNKRFVYSRNES